MKRVWVPGVVGLALGALGCDEATGASERLGGTRGGDRIACAEEPSETRVGWDEDTALGVAPRQAFAAIAGSCEALFWWDASGSDLAVEPARGEARIAVHVTIDEASARVVDPQDGSDAPPCAPWLEVDAKLGLESDDGVFSDNGKVSLRYTKEGGVASFGLTRAAYALGGSLQISAKANQEVLLTYNTSGADDACAGELQLSWSEQRGNMGSGAVGNVGGWSSSGCRLGQEPVPLDDGDSASLGATIQREIAAQWGATSFAGSWEGGGATELLLVVMVDATQACAETSGSRMVEVPVRVRYGTSDRRIQDHETHAHVNVFRDTESVSQLQLVLSETLSCEPNATHLPRLDERCSAFARAEAQLLINHYLGRGAGEGTTLEVYKYKPGNPGVAADEVERLTLAPR